MKQISTSIYTFEDLIQGNVLYVDKTKFFYQLVTAPKGQTVHKLGINFCYDKEVRNISDWREESIDSSV